MISERGICDFKKMVNFDKGLPVYVYTVLYTILIAYFLDIETWCFFYYYVYLWVNKNVKALCIAIDCIMKV